MFTRNLRTHPRKSQALNQPINLTISLQDEVLMRFLNPKRKSMLVVPAKSRTLKAKSKFLWKETKLTETSRKR